MANKSDEPRRLEMGEELSMCPDCGYTRGFHSIFKRAAVNGDMDWMLQCPNCGLKFDVGLVAVRRALGKE